MALHVIVKLQTHIPIDDCKSRLAASMDAERLAFSRSGYAGSKEILGKIRGTGFRLQKRRYYRNSFAPYFYGRLEAADGGTRIEGEFKMHPAARIFMTFWFSFLALFAAAALILPSQGQPEAGRLPFLAVAAFMAAFGVGLIKFSRWLARGEKVAIMDFLKSKLEASDAH